MIGSAAFEQPTGLAGAPPTLHTQQLRRLTVLACAAGVVAVIAAAVVALYPLHTNGVSGTALAPQYHAFGWYAYTPLSGQVSSAELRAAGVRVPQDVVDHRRHVATELAAAGVVLATIGVVARRRKRAD